MTHRFSASELRGLPTYHGDILFNCAGGFRYPNTCRRPYIQVLSGSVAIAHAELQNVRPGSAEPLHCPPTIIVALYLLTRRELVGRSADFMDYAAQLDTSGFVLTDTQLKAAIDCLAISFQAVGLTIARPEKNNRGNRGRSVEAAAPTYRLVQMPGVKTSFDQLLVWG